jgi:FkbM family methyltransferase
MNTNNRIVESDFGPIIVNVHDTHIGASIVRYGYWMQDELAHTLALIEQLLRTKPLVRVYDVGANIGTHSLAIASRFRERVTVRAFEAQHTIFQMLCGTMAINDLRNVTCHHNAVADVSGIDLEFDRPDYTQANNFGSLELMPPRNSDNHLLAHSGVERVRSVSIDSFDEAVDFIKIDVEGMEPLVLRGAARTLMRHRPVLLVETLKCGGDMVADTLASYDYRVQRQADCLWATPREMKLD